MKTAILCGVVAAGLSAPTFAAFDNSGTYLCTVAEKAGLSERHLEGAGPPRAINYPSPMTRFRMRISPIDHKKMHFSLVEIAYDGADRDDAEWHTDNSVLHGEYRGDGNSFTARKDQAFFAFGKTRHKNGDGDYEFYHAGFEYPGGEDTKLSVRWGRCKKV